MPLRSNVTTRAAAAAAAKKQSQQQPDQSQPNQQQQPPNHQQTQQPSAALTHSNSDVDYCLPDHAGFVQSLLYKLHLQTGLYMLSPLERRTIWILLILIGTLSCVYALVFFKGIHDGYYSSGMNSTTTIDMDIQHAIHSQSINNHEPLSAAEFLEENPILPGEL
jgi:hypothetical protein